MQTGGEDPEGGCNREEEDQEEGGRVGGKEGGGGRGSKINWESKDTIVGKGRGFKI